MPEPILVPNDALPRFAGKMKFQMFREELIAFATYAVQRQAMPEPAK
jgi:hypothetical protein